MDIGKEVLNGLTEDMKEKVGACATAADLVALAESEGVELNDEQLDMVSGGGGWDEWDCSTLDCSLGHAYL